MSEISKWLPDGWTVAPYPRLRNVYVIDRAQKSGGGILSLDFDLRVWCGGHTIPRSFPRDVERKYAGRGWRERMVRDACAWLESVMTNGGSA